MSLLSIIDGACGELNIAQPATVIVSTDLAARQLLALARKEGKELARRFDWQILMKQATFTTVAAEIQVASLSTTFTDFSRIINDTMWNRTQSWKVSGPLTPQQWQMRLASAAQAGIRNFSRIRGDALIFNPVPTAGDAVYFEYLSTKWCQSSLGVAQSDWAADTDTALIEEEVIRLGVVWRFLKAKGLDYSEEFRTYEMALIDIFGSDGGSSVLNLSAEDEPMLGANIPESNWVL